jgi:E3 ubiquitin-protein ligase UHRF1
MYVRVRIVDGETNTVIAIWKLTSVEEFRVLVERKLAIERGKQRFFYRGKQLEDGYRTFDYDVRLNYVIRLMIKPDCETPLSPSKASAAAIIGEHTGAGFGKSELKLTEFSSKYYEVGDLIHVRIVSNGAGKIVGLVKMELAKYIHKSKMELGLKDRM